MTRRRASVLALSAWLLAGAIGCQTGPGAGPRAGTSVVGLPPWTIGGARIGMTPAEVEGVLGAPTSTETRYGKTTTWWRRDISVTFDQDGRAIEVFGDRLTSPNGATLFSRGAAEAEVVAQIGPGRQRSHYGPGGSGVINCSRRRTGGVYTHEDQTTLYEITTYEGRLASVRLLPR